ncbi:hypothetical protein PBAL39_20485 [Pedobacter sp. BAL39]|nr:hypothetical protein PBAL39_20485 [Pedobacter sp. BAL39]
MLLQLECQSNLRDFLLKKLQKQEKIAASECQKFTFDCLGSFRNNSENGFGLKVLMQYT